MTAAPSIRLAVFDWAGTTVDHGCFAPVQPFVDAFAQHGVRVTVADARGPMGLDKRDHIRELLALPGVVEQWRAAHRREPVDRDVEAVYAAFVPLQLESVAAASVLIDGLLQCIERLRARGIRIGTTTGYFPEAAALCYEAAAKQGYHPDINLSLADVSEGRPAPWMIFRIMETLRVHPPSAVIKIGDTVPDIAEGLNAGAWSVGVAATGSDVGLTAGELAALSHEERERRVDAAKRKLLAAGAHYVIDSIRDVPDLVEEIDARLACGENPSRPRVIAS